MEKMKKKVEEKKERGKQSLEKYKILFWILLIIILVVIVICIGRKIVILNSLSQNAKKYAQATNYYTKMYMYQGEDSVLMESFYKDNKNLTTLTTLKGNNKSIEYNDGKDTTTYLESNGQKIAFENTDYKISTFTSLEQYKEYITVSFANVFGSKIISTICNGRECYYISEVNNSQNLEGTSVFIDKETGLPIRILQGGTKSEGNEMNTIIDFDFEFNNVKDKDIVKPDIREYKVQE